MTESDASFFHRWSRRKLDQDTVEEPGDNEGPVRRPGVMNTDPPPPPLPVTEDDGDVEQSEDVAMAVQSPGDASLPPCEPADSEAGGSEPGDSEPADSENEIASDSDADDDVDVATIDIDALDFQSDYTRFMKDGVPEAIRRRALRHLWQSDPILANVDGLNDYDEDYSDAALAVKVLKTSHNVGRGYQTEEEIRAAQNQDVQPDLADEDGEDQVVAEVADEASDEAVDGVDADDAETTELASADTADAAEADDNAHDLDTLAEGDAGELDDQASEDDEPPLA